MMKTIYSSLAALFVALLSPLEAAPAFTNITALQRGGTNLVDVGYDLTTPGLTSVTVSMQISRDAGATWTVPAASLTGDVGEEITAGAGKAIVWDAGTDWLENYSHQVRFRLVADEGILADEVDLPGFALIPGGSFTMGATSGDVVPNAPPITVTVSPFHLAKTEMTKETWDEVRTWALAHGYTGLGAGSGKAPGHPVYGMSWVDAMRWCNARSEMEGLTPCYTVSGFVLKSGGNSGLYPDVNWGADGYRLPTEAEWEKAARGGVSGKRFPEGTDKISHTQANYYGSSDYSSIDDSPINDHHQDYDDGTEPYTSPVESFTANGYGLKNMAGNVWEWCWDYYKADYYATSAGTTDPRGPVTFVDRVVRGGDWQSHAVSLNCAYRLNLGPLAVVSEFNVGFRVARSNPSPASLLLPGEGKTLASITVDTRSVIPAPRPDVAVGAVAPGLTGAAIYAPASQVASLISKKARPVTGYVRVFNRDDLSEVLTLTGGRGNGFFTVSWFGAEGNLTAQMNAGLYRTPSLGAASTPLDLSVTVVPNKKKLMKKRGGKIKIVKKTLSIGIRAASTSDPSQVDAATILVETK